jgi:Ca2+-binding RTX toxin-like protein/methionine-rich copper-binding protein CopC
MAMSWSTSSESNTVPRYGIGNTPQSIDGLAGTDTLSFDRLLRSRFTITRDASTGIISVDSVSGASSTFHYRLTNVEKLSFNEGQDTVVLATYFDTTAPIVSSYSPADGLTTVAVSSNIVLTFNETIAKGTGTIAIYSGSASGTLVESFDAAVTSTKLVFLGSTLTINPTNNLSAGTQYFVTFASGTVKDTAGNSFAGTSVYDFTTVAANHLPSGAVTITGTKTQGQTLTATNTLADTDGLGTVSYQWQAGGVNISGATASTYTLMQAEVGKAITVVASYTDVLGNAESVASSASTSVANLNDAPTGAVTITGVLADGRTLTGSHSLADADGLGTVSYQWQADGTNISGATGSTYTLTSDEVGKAITVVASYIDVLGTAESVSSSASASVAVLNALPTGAVTITGTASLGNTLTATNTLADEEGLGTVSYQWQADGVNISGATSSTYTLTQAAVGKAITVVASYTDGLGVAESLSSGGINTGTAAVDTLTGGSGSDTLTGGLGIDIMDGADGADLYMITTAKDHAASEITDTGSSGTDEVRFSATAAGMLTLYAGDTGIEKVTIGTGNAANAVSTGTLALNINAAALTNALTITGNAGVNSITGTAYNDTIDGGLGADKLTGGLGNDLYYVDIVATTGALQDTVTEALNGGTDSLVLRGTSTNATALTLVAAANLESLDASATVSSKLNLTGNLLANTLTGNAAANILNGMGGADTLIGGAGNDTYVVDNLNDVVTEETDAGTDLIQIAIATAATAANPYVLGDAIENATLTSTVAYSLTGNALANVLTGNAAINTLTGGIGNDTLNGAAGADILVGGIGDDTYVIDNAGDVVIEVADAGTDTIESSITKSLALLDSIENLTLTGTAALNATGSAAGNVLTGNAGANILDGGAGADTMSGGNGADTYIVDDLADVVSETNALATGGIDLVQSSVSFELGANLEKLTLTGSSAIDGTGNALANTLTGNIAANILDGSGGIDVLIGGAGDDTYIVDLLATGALQDTVTEALNGGTDTLVLRGTSINTTASTHTLAVTMENIDASATGSSKLNLTGNLLANTLTGNDAANILNGGLGTDTLDGGDGADIYLVTTIAEHSAAEFSDTGSSGLDEIRFASKVASTLTLYAGDTGIESVVIGTGLVAAAVSTGKVALNVDASAVLNGLSISGNAGVNNLTGTAFADTLNGGLGNDILTGGSGADNFVFNKAANASTNKDTITDFVSGTDILQFSKTTFTGLGASTGMLAETQFYAGASAQDAADRIIFNATTGALLYDADGSGRGAAVQVALMGLTVHPVSLVYSDFLIIT